MNTDDFFDFAEVKLCIALRTARAVTGWSQYEFATRVGLTQSSVARMENCASGISFTLMHRVIKTYADVGVDLNVMSTENLTVTVRPKALKAYQEKMNKVA